MNKNGDTFLKSLIKNKSPLDQNPQNNQLSFNKKFFSMLQLLLEFDKKLNIINDANDDVMDSKSARNYSYAQTMLMENFRNLVVNPQPQSLGHKKFGCTFKYLSIHKHQGTFFGANSENSPSPWKTLFTKSVIKEPENTLKPKLV